MPIEICIHKGKTEPTEKILLNGAGHDGLIDGTPFTVTKEGKIYHLKAKIGDATMNVIMEPGSAYAITSKNGHIIDMYRPK